MATHPTIAFRAVRCITGLPVPRFDFPEAAGRTFKAGAPVVLVSGYLEECGANPALIAGIAQRDGQNGAAAGSKTQTIVVAHPDIMFIGNLDNNDAGNGTGAADDRGKMYGITKNASGQWRLDKNKAATATRRVIIWDLWDQVIPGATGSAGEPAWTDTLPIVVFTFDINYCQMFKTV